MDHKDSRRCSQSVIGLQIKNESTTCMLADTDSNAIDDKQSEANVSDDNRSDLNLKECEKSKGANSIHHKSHKSFGNRLKIFCFGRELPKKTTNFFRFKKIFSAVIFIALFYYDITTDILLAVDYYRIGEWMYFGLTTTFIVVPLLIVNVYNIFLLSTGDNYAEETKHLTLRMLCSIPFMSAPVDGIIVYAYYSIKRGIDWDRIDGDLGTYFKVIVAFMEDIPQLALQLYITLTESSDEINVYTHVLRSLSMTASWISVITTMNMYVINDYEFQKEKKLPLFEQCMLFVYNASETGLRVIVFVLFTVQFKYKVLAVFFPHWTLLMIWLLHYHNTTDTNHFSFCDRIVFPLTQSIILTFSSGVDKFVARNPCSNSNGTMTLKGFIYHLVIFIENVVMFVSWLCFTPLTGFMYYSIICSIALFTVLCKVTSLSIRQLNKDFV